MELSDYEKSIIKKAPLEDLIELRIDVIPVSHYNKCAFYKDKKIKELEIQLNKMRKLEEILKEPLIRKESSSDIQQNEELEISKEDLLEWQKSAAGIDNN